MPRFVTSTRREPLRGPVRHQSGLAADCGASITALVVSILVTALMLPVMLGVTTDTLKLAYIRAERITSIESNSRLTALFSAASAIDGCATLVDTNDKTECAVAAKSDGVALLGDNAAFGLPSYSLCVLTTPEDIAGLRQRRCLVLEGDTDNVVDGVDTAGGGNLTIRSWVETDPAVLTPPGERFIPTMFDPPNPDKHEQVVYRDVEWWCTIFTTSTVIGGCPDPSDPFERYPQTVSPASTTFVYGSLQQQFDRVAPGTPGCGGGNEWWRVSDVGCDGSMNVPQTTADAAVVPLVPQGLTWNGTQREPAVPALVTSIEVRICVAIDADERLERLGDDDADSHCELNVLGFTLTGSE